MAKKNYAKLEEHIINQFQPGTKFEFDQTEYQIVSLDDVGKPRPASSWGECKTDVYIAAVDDKNNRDEFKISVKLRSSNEFNENKVKKDKAEAYFGSDWSSILTDAIATIKDRFFERQLVFIKGDGRIKPNSITLGWKLEITNKPRTLSVKPNLSEKEIRDYVYKGTNQPESKRNAIVKNRTIRDSGVAHYIIKTEMEDISSASDVIEQMQAIDDIDIGETYLVFTANNYRTDTMTADGARSLAVAISWQAHNGKIRPYFIFNEPLEHTGEKDMANDLIKALSEIGFDVPCELPSDFVEKYVDLSHLN